MLQLDSLAITSMLAYMLLWGITIVAAPKRDLRRCGTSGLLMMLAGTLLSYAAGSIWIFVVGWALTALPSFMRPQAYSVPKASIAAEGIALLVGAIALSIDAPIARTIAFGAFLLAAAVRAGIFPFQFWTSQVFDTASLPALNLWLNSRLGIYLLIRFAIPLVQDTAHSVLPIISMWALVAALYATLLALAESRPRRVLGLLYASQVGFTLMGLTTFTLQGITGALISWWVTALAITGLIAVYTSLEARTSEVASPSAFLGLGIHAPRLAVFFVICALALAGLPGTLGFAAQDLLIQGSLTVHPWLGVAVPLAEAFNAITVLRLFTTLFLGRRGIHVSPIPDANIGERWALAAVVGLLVAGGIAPVFFISLRAPTAEWLIGLLSGR